MITIIFIILIGLMGGTKLLVDVIRGSISMVGIKTAIITSVVFFLLLIASTHWFDKDYCNMTKSIMRDVFYRVLYSIILFCIVYGVISLF